VSLDGESCGASSSSGQTGTAYMTALMRAAHQVLDGGAIYSDPHSVMLVDDKDLARIARLSGASGQRLEFVRLYVATRSRFGAECLSASLAAGQIQLVVVGAGLDMISYVALQDPNVSAAYEVDRAPILAWKAARAREVLGPAPVRLHTIAANLGSDSLEAVLARAGHTRSARTFFYWMGVVPYLPSSLVAEILKFIGSQPSGSAVAFDYLLRNDDLNEAEERAQRVLARRVGRSGEPFSSRMTTRQVEGLVDAAKLEMRKHTDIRDAVSSYGGVWPAVSELTGNWSRLVLAVVP
jgi:methyltransferase (TIGR00027 family)